MKTVAFLDLRTFSYAGGEEDKAAGAFLYISFAGGRHGCLGEPFAYLQIKCGHLVFLFCWYWSPLGLQLLLAGNLIKSKDGNKMDCVGKYLASNLVIVCSW